MTDRFDEVYPRFAAHEGGFVNHPKDPGGATNRGVTLATYRRFYGQHKTVEDLKNITTEEVKHIFRTGYWDTVKADDLPIGIDYLVADMSINAGPSRASKILQKAVGTAQDGVIGPVTLAATDAFDPERLEELARTYTQGRADFYRSLGTFPTFGAGWKRRWEEAYAYALGDIHEAQLVDPEGPGEPGLDKGTIDVLQTYMQAIRDANNIIAIKLEEVDDVTRAVDGLLLELEKSG